MTDIFFSNGDNLQTILTVATTLATIGLFAVACFQLNAIRTENKKWKSIEAAERFDFDPVIEKATKEIFFAKKTDEDEKQLTETEETKKEKRNAIVILNALDCILIGIDQKVYIEQTIKQHIKESLFRGHELITSKIVDSHGYERIIK